MKRYTLGPLDMVVHEGQLGTVQGETLTVGGPVTVEVVNEHGSTGWPEATVTGTLPALLAWQLTFYYTEDQPNSHADAIALLEPDNRLLREVS